MRWIHKIGLGLSLTTAPLQASFTPSSNSSSTSLTGGQSGVYYPMGVALSQIYAKSIPNVRATAQVTKASAENLNLLQAGRGELALALADWSPTPGRVRPRQVSPRSSTSCAASRAPTAITSRSWPMPIRASRPLADPGRGAHFRGAASQAPSSTRAIFKAAGLTYADLAKVEYRRLASRSS